MPLLICLQPLRLALIAFGLAIAVTGSLIGYSEYLRVQHERSQIQDLLNARIEFLKDNLNQTLSISYSLAALVYATQGNGQYFNAVAKYMLSSQSGAVSLALAPGGTIQYHTPLAGANLAGLNLFAAPEYADAAQAARHSGQMALSRVVAITPDTIQMLGMLPIFLQENGSKPVFWGFANVILRFPETLASMHLSKLAEQKLVIQLTGTDQTTGLEQQIWGATAQNLLDPVEVSIPVANFLWKLRAAPSQGWLNQASLTLKVLSGIAFSLLFAYLVKLCVQRKMQQQMLKHEVERMTAEILPLKNNLEAILQVTPDLLCELDVAGHCCHCYCPEEHLLPAHIRHLRKQLIAEVMAPEIASVILPAIHEAQQRGFSYGKQLVLPFETEEFCFELAVAHKTNAENPRFIILSRDITQSVNDARHLATSESKLRAIIENEPECVKLVAKDGALLEINPSGLEMIDADSLDQVIGKNILNLVYEEYREPFKRLNEKVFSGESGSIEFEIRSLKDNPRWLSSRTVPFRDAAGKIVAALSVTSNITAQKQYALERQYNEILMNTTLDSTDEGLLVVSKAGQILLANRRFYELWNVPQFLAESRNDEELLTYVLAQLTDPDQFLCEVKRLYDSEEQARDTLHFKDGRVYARFSRSLLINQENGRIWCFKDISEQHSAQVALIEREEIYRSIVTQAADGVVLIDAETKGFVEFNDAACTQLGYSREEFATMTIADIQGEFDSEAIDAKVQIILAAGAADFDTLHRRKDGALRNIRVSNRVINLHGRQYFAAILTDITERIRVEQALRQKERYQRALLDSFPFIAWLKDTESRYLAVNKVFIEACGVQSFNELIGKNDFDVWPQDLAQSYVADDVEVLKTRCKKNVEGKIAVQGKTQWFETYKAPVLDSDGELLGTVGFAREISDRKRIEEDLRLSRERLYFALKGSNDGFWDWNLETNEVYYSPRWKSMLGFADDELENNMTTWAQLVDPAVRENVLKYAQAYVEGRATEFEVEFRMWHKQAYWVDILSRAKLAEDEQGQPLFPMRLIGTHVDITERKRVAAALAESTALLNSILHNIPVRVFWKDTQSRYLGCNAAFARDAGLEVKDLIGKDDTQLVWQEQAALYQADDQLVMQSQTPKLSYDEPQTGSDGKQIWLRTSKVPLRNNADAVIGILGIYEDITVYKQAEQDLLESETRFRKLFEDTAEATLLIEDGNIIDANAAALKLLGMEHAQQLIHCKFTAISPLFQMNGTLSAVVFDNLLQLLEGHNVQQLEWELNKLNGEQMIAELLITPILYQKRQILHIVLRDITVRKTIEIALRRSEESLNHAQAIGHVGSWMLRFASNEFECSLETYRIFGIIPQQKIDFGLFIEHIYPVDRERFLNAWHSALSGKTILDIEHRLLVEGVIRWVRERAEIEFSMDGKPLVGIGTAQEITQQKMIETELEQHRFHLENLVNLRTSELEEAMQIAETANRTKSTFLANMSHEIRTPMNAIIGLTHLLRKDISEPKHRAQLLKVSDAAQHLLAIINDVLDLSKIEAGKFNLEQIRFSPLRIVDHVMSMLGERAAVKGLFFRSEIDLDLPKVLIGDPFRLQQVLLNFVNNAIKFSTQGTITIRVKQLGELQQDNRLAVCFEVEDQGIGLSVEQQSRLFKAFVQADESTTRKYGGTGLGLAIVKRIADMMEGRVGVESELGVGSRFWMTAQLGISEFDFQEEEEYEIPVSELQLDIVLKDQYRGARILVAEDDPVNQEVAKELLQDAGFIVDVVDNGALAVERLAITDYALVLMDMQMPVMDGIAATRAIRQLPGKSTLPVIAMTANAFDEDRELCLQVGMNDHVGKPVDPEKLYQALLRWLPTFRTQRRSELASVVHTEIDYTKVLEKIPQIDVRLGQRAVRGNLYQLVSLLKIFVETHADDMTQLRHHIANGAIDDARRLVHTLKGITATLGALSLQQAAIELESILQTQTDSQELLLAIKPFAEELTLFMRDVQVALNSIFFAPKEKHPEYDVYQTGKVLWKLEELLAQDDTRVNGVWLESEGLLDAALGAEAGLLKQYINEFKYDQALAYLRKILPGLAPRSRV